MIKLRNVNYTIQAQKILDDISLDIKKGKVTVILGPSGAGKSTLLRTINFLAKPDSGQIIFDGREFDAKTIGKKEIAYLRRNIGMIFQSYPLFVNKTVLENITECLRIVHNYSRKEAKEIAMDCLKQVRLEDKIHAYPKHLSGGQKQRVSIARILAVQSKLILMDEPTSALDHNLIDEVLETIETLVKKGITVVIVTHDLNFAKSVADEAYFLNSGRITAQGKVTEVFDYAQL